VGNRIDDLHVRRQREDDADQAVLAQVAEVVGVRARGAEVVRIDRAEERIVGVAVEAEPPLQELEAPLRVRGRELEVVGHHVAVVARPPVALTVRAAVEEVEEAAGHRITGLPAAEPVV